MSKKIASIVVEGLSTGYSSKEDDVVITRNINAALFPGEITCLLGPNGAGKSTLLKTLTSFIPSRHGSISILGKNIKNYSSKELSTAIGVVLTEKPELTNMTAEELVKMGRSPYTGFWGHTTEDDNFIVDESLKLVGIDSLRYRMIQTLSDGERQKVMIAKALAQETPIIVLDEPTAFLDYPSKVEIMQLLQKLARVKGKTVFLSIHDLELALQTADKIWLLDKEHGVTIGTPEDLSLRNEIGRYFHRDGITFDCSSGTFRILNDYHSEVSLTGAGAAFNMTLKALSRRGISVNDDPEGQIIINADDEGILLNGIIMSSIEELIETVEDMIAGKEVQS